MEQLIKELNQVNWDFSDYYSTKYPLEISSLPWYLATYPAPLAKFLIGLLSNDGDIVLDPFGGAGTTCYEAVKLNRRFIYNDLNPFAADIVNQLLEILLLKLNQRNAIKNIIEEEYLILEQKALEKELFWIDDTEYYSSDIDKRKIDLPEAELAKRGISSEAYNWYHVKTLKQLLIIYDLIETSKTNSVKSLRKFAFINKLKDMSSQRYHYTYITDNCKPNLLQYNDAVDIYLHMLNRIDAATTEMVDNYLVINSDEQISQTIRNSTVKTGDARNMKWIESESVDFVMTSPPYVCAQDYIKTMRLVNLFYSKGDLKTLSSDEIGQRVKRKGSPDKVVGEFYNDLKLVIREIHRVLKKGKFFCLIIGQGKGKITSGYNTVEDIREYIMNQYKFELVFEKERHIGHKSQRIGGVSEETIFVFKKGE